MARRGSTISAKSWTGTQFDATVVSTTQEAMASVSLPETNVTGTVLRVRGGLFLKATPNAATDDDVVGLGLIMVHSNALAAGGVALPGPINDMGADWLWHQFVGMNSAQGTPFVPLVINSQTGGV